MTADAGVYRISSETTFVSMTTMAARSSEFGRPAHRSALAKLELDATKRREARVDGAAQILLGRCLADGAPQDIARFLLH